MKKVLALLFLVVGLVAYAQPPEYDDLTIYKADDNWEKLIRAAEKYTLKDDTKSDPLPYYYLAYGLYEISLIGDRDEEYKNAFKDALTTTGKFSRKDKDGSVYQEKREFFDMLKMQLVKTIQFDIEAGDYRKSYSWIMKVYKFNKDDVGAKYLEGACKYRAADKSTARLKWREANAMLDEVTSVEDWSEADMALLKMGLVESALILNESRQEDTAKELMNKGKQWFEDDEIFMEKYDEIVNGQ